MKKFISILLVFCLSGCTVLDFVAEDTQKQTDYLYNYDYKETNTNTENQTQTKEGFTVKNSDNKNNKNQTKKGFELVDNSKKELQSLYLFYYEQLTPLQKTVYEDLYAFMKKPTSIYELKKPVKLEDLSPALYAFMYDFPESYWMWNYRYRIGDNGKVTELEFIVPEDLESKWAQVDAIANNVVAAVANESDYNKLKYFYEWIINWTEYQENECDQDYTGVFLLKQSVCAGYARAFQYLCKKAGLKCTTVRGQTNESHAWNLVELNGQYYWVDVTWGDPTTDDGSQKLVYYYFMVTDELLFRTHISLNGQVPVGSYEKIDVFKFPQCTDNSLSYYIQNGAYFETYDYYAIRDYVLQKLYENPYQEISFQIGNQESFYYAVEELLKNNRYITNIFSEYFPGRYYYNAITKDDAGVITVQIVS